MAEFEKGDKVEGRSHGGKAVGEVLEKITGDTEGGGRTVRASKDEPQYLVRSEKSGGTRCPQALGADKARLTSPGTTTRHTKEPGAGR